MWVYIILIIIVAGFLFLTEIGRAILKWIAKLVIMGGFLYLGYWILKFFIDRTSDI